MPVRRLTASLALLAALIALGIAPQARADHHAHIVHGVITHVDLEHHAIVLHTENHDLLIHVHPHTQITLNGDPAELADLMPGDRARVRIVRDREHPHFHFAATHIRARRL